jgi:hypothetical protein
MVLKLAAYRQQAIGVTEMLREDAEALKQDVEPLDRVLGAGRHLLALINDILARGQRARRQCAGCRRTRGRLCRSHARGRCR